MRKLLTILLTMSLSTFLISCGTDTPGEISKDGIFNEIIVVDNEDSLIKITNVEEDDIFGYSIKATLENKSDETTYLYSVQSASINGVESNTLFATEVAPGEILDESISLSTSFLEENGVTSFNNIQITFRVYNPSDWLADEVALETVNIYPNGEKEATEFVRESEDTDNIIVDNEYVSAIITGYDPNSTLGYSANIYLVNKTDKNIMFTSNDVYINGVITNPFFATPVSAGNTAFSSISWSNDILAENEITEIEEIKFNFKAYDTDDFMADDFANEVITLTP